ncbi:hypothetical protein Bca101_099754 [Brassica carinata]
MSKMYEAIVMSIKNLRLGMNSSLSRPSSSFKRPTSKRGNDERPVLFQLGSIASDARLKDDPEITNSRPASPSLSPSSSGNNNAKERKLSELQSSSDTLARVTSLCGACASSFVGRFQGDQQFDAEILSLETVRHPNLVMLIGYHASETEMFLIYNYLSGGNLEDFIKERSKPALEWKILQKIALDVARAVAYLHEQCSAKVLHRDIKPSNILLDNNYNAYLSDFGLSKLLGTSQSHGVAGTIGYVAPEYAMTCRVSEKADVYSYGIVILELISDKRAAGSFFLFSREWIQHCLVKSKLRMFSQRDYGRLVLRTI